MLEKIKRKFGTLSTKRRRILTLDLLRGFFLFAIILNHTPLAPRLTDIVTGGGTLFVSAAEGFFIISGLLVGYLYAHKIVLHTRTILKKIWSRALLLYITSITTTLIFTLAGRIFFDPSGSSHFYTGNFLELRFWQEILSLSYVYGWADFLSRYAVFMLFAPLGLFLIALRKTYVLALLSTLLWFVSPVVGLQEFTAWQILFVFGMITGSHLEEILDIFKKKNRQPLLYIPIGIFALTAGFSLYATVIYPGYLRELSVLPDVVRILSDKIFIRHEILMPFFNKEFLGLGRIILAFVWFTAFFTVFWRYENNIKRYTYGLFEFLGKNTLTAYIIHAGVIYALFLVFTDATNEHSKTFNTVIALGALAATVVLTWLYNNLRISIGNKKAIADSRHQGE